MPEDVKRYDFITLPGSIKKTDEGFIEADPVVTRTGVFSYRLPDGTIRREFRSDEEVFAADALGSLKMIPITDTHPSDFVTPENAKELAIGMTGENARRDGDNVRVPIKITTESGVNAVEGGRLQLSLGYKCHVERKDGEFKGETFTHIQRRIRCNHLALCDKARAGAQATLRLDAQDAVMVQETKKRKETKAMDGSVRLDNGITYECAPEVEKAYAELATKHSDAAAKRDEHKAALDALQGKHDAQTKELEEAKKVDHADAVAKGVKSRVALVEAVKPMLSEEDVKKVDEMSDAQLRIAAITATDEKFDAKDEDGKVRSDDYLKARFDGAVIAFEKSEKAKQGSAVVGDGSGRKDEDDDPDKARQEMIERQDGKKKAKDKE